MGDTKDLGRIMSSLKIHPSEIARQKAKAAFLQKAEESTRSLHILRKSRFQLSRKAVLTFVAGAASMLILAAGFRSFLNPGFLSGTIAENSGIVRYRAFPPQVTIPSIRTYERYAGEIVLLPAPPGGETIRKEFLKCDGKRYDASKYPTLFSVLGVCSGNNQTASAFRVPDLSKSAVVPGFQYYIRCGGEAAVSAGQHTGTEKTSIVYAPENAGASVESLRVSVCYGQIVLLKLPGLEAYGGFLPCSGQTLRAADYPELSSALGVRAKTFVLPDLRGQSPVSGAGYYICNTGTNPYDDP